MKKIIVIGCPGSGKSTFSRSLGKLSGISVFHLDMLFWNADKTTVEKPVFYERLSEIMRLDEWIIDGNFSSTMEQRIAECDTVFFFDIPTADCLDGVRRRIGKERPDMPWTETQEDAEFMQFIKDFNTQRKPQIIQLLQKYPDKAVFIFKTRAEADDFLTRREL